MLRNQEIKSYDNTIKLKAKNPDITILINGLLYQSLFLHRQY